MIIATAPIYAFVALAVIEISAAVYFAVFFAVLALIGWAILLPFRPIFSLISRR